MSRLKRRRPDHQKAKHYQQRQSRLAQNIRIEVQRDRKGVQSERDEGEGDYKACHDEQRPRSRASSD
jgi:hypothetical protein